MDTLSISKFSYFPGNIIFRDTSKKYNFLLRPIIIFVRRRITLSVAIITFLLLGFLQFSQTAHAQQRVIINQNFIELKNSAGTLLGSFNSQYPNMFCTPGGILTTPSPTGTGNCLRYVNDSRCEAPIGGPADTDICVVGWETASPEIHNGAVSKGFIAHPIQIGITTNGLLEGVSAPAGSAELNAEVPNKIYQNICLASGESIPFSFDLADPNATRSEASQASIAIWPLNSGFPTAALNSFTSSPVNTRAFQTFSDTLTAPAAAGVYQVGFEAVTPTGASGNYLQNVNIQLAPLIDMGGTGTLTGSPSFVEPTAGVTQVSILSFRVNGTVGAGVQIPINLTGSTTATPDADFSLGTPTGPIGSPTLTHVSGSSTWILNVPPGGYSGGLEQANIEIPISLVADGALETTETFAFELGAPSGGALISDPLCASDFIATSGAVSITNYTTPPIPQIPTLPQWVLFSVSMMLLSFGMRVLTRSEST